MSDTYFASVLYVSTAPEPDYRPLYDETFIMVRASSTEQAGKKAEQYGRKSEHEYVSVAGFHIKWRFVEVRNVVITTDDDFEDDIMELSGRFFHNLKAYDKILTTD